MDFHKPRKKSKKTTAKTRIIASPPQLKDGCVIKNHVCRGRCKVCPTCSMVYCDKHFNREIHIDYCEARAKQDWELIQKQKDGNTKL